jgi:hypothetical protein
MGNTAVMLAVVVGILSSMPRQEGILILAQPVPEEERLQPESVVLEYRYWWQDEQYWEEAVYPVRFLSAEYGEEMLYPAEDGTVHAPVPLTWEQAQSLVPGAAVGEIEGARWVLVLLDDCSFAYYFDGEGRTGRVVMDPVADSGVYTFTYNYEEPVDPRGWIRPTWVIDLLPGGIESSTP